MASPSPLDSRRPARARRALLGVLAALPLVAAAASAEIYQWTDANGKVHFSDKPPAGAAAAARSPAASDPASSAAASGGQAIAYRGKEASRRARLERVLVDLRGASGERVEIGTSGTGPTCKTRQKMFWVAGDQLDVSGSNLPDRFGKRLAELGYARAEEARFQSQVEAPSEISVSATIVEIERKQCQAYGQAGVSRGERNSTQLEVHWEVFDNLRRVTVLEADSAGSHNDFRNAKEQSGARESISRAFIAALDELLARPDFVALLEPDTKASAAAPLPARSDVELRYASAEPAASFTSRVAALKAATVTVRTGSGHGSGFLVSKAGHVLTNHHVVSGARELMVVFDGEQIPARVVAEHPMRDVALLALDRAPAIEPLSVARAPAQVGESVYVIGTPLDEALSHTVTRGIISAEREQQGQHFYQTDASVNPGNSGGPALNERGEVIGMAVAGVFTRDGASLSINYLIPISEALQQIGLAAR